MSDSRTNAVTRVSRSEFDELYEYSCSLPTGKTIGKRWKKNANAFRAPVRITLADDCPSLTLVVPWPEDWWMGEYVPHADPGYVGIRWSKIEITR